MDLVPQPKRVLLVVNGLLLYKSMPTNAPLHISSLQEATKYENKNAYKSYSDAASQVF